MGDNDWQAVTLEDYGLGYTAHEVRVSLQTEKEAIEVLMGLFDCETGETRQKMRSLTHQMVERTGKTPAEILLGLPAEG